MWGLAVLALGFVCLYLGAEWLVRGALLLSRRFGLSKAFVGGIMVAFGTSAPELFVNLIAASHGRTGLALANIAGSNFTNICVGFGTCSLIGTIVIQRGAFARELAYCVLTPTVVLVTIIVMPGDTLSKHALVGLVAMLAAYLYSVRDRIYEKNVEAPGTASALAGFSFFVLGGILLYLGGEAVVNGSVSVARRIGVSESVIGFTAVAIGTSIPDVAASIIAFVRGEVEVAVGNILGSNIFNILVVLAGTVAISKSALVFSRIEIIDYGIVSVVTAALAIQVWLRNRVGRLSGALMLLVFVAYFGYRVTFAN